MHRFSISIISLSLVNKHLKSIMYGQINSSYSFAYIMSEIQIKFKIVIILHLLDTWSQHRANCHFASRGHLQGHIPG